MCKNASVLTWLLLIISTILDSQTFACGMKLQRERTLGVGRVTAISPSNGETQGVMSLPSPPNEPIRTPAQNQIMMAHSTTSLRQSGNRRRTFIVSGTGETNGTNSLKQDHTHYPTEPSGPIPLRVGLEVYFVDEDEFRCVGQITHVLNEKQVRVEFSRQDGVNVALYEQEINSADLLSAALALNPFQIGSYVYWKSEKSFHGGKVLRLFTNAASKEEVAEIDSYPHLLSAQSVDNRIRYVQLSELRILEHGEGAPSMHRGVHVYSYLNSRSGSGIHRVGYILGFVPSKNGHKKTLVQWEYWNGENTHSQELLNTKDLSEIVANSNEQIPDPDVDGTDRRQIYVFDGKVTRQFSNGIVEVHWKGGHRPDGVFFSFNQMNYYAIDRVLSSKTGEVRLEVPFELFQRSNKGSAIKSRRTAETLYGTMPTLVSPQNDGIPQGYGVISNGSEIGSRSYLSESSEMELLGTTLKSPSPEPSPVPEP